VDAVEEVKSRLSIEDVVSQYVELKRSGRNFKGLSPFSSEKSPSFMVSPEKQIWHDFSSGKGGDMFTLVMELEGLDFRAALELLARKAGVDLEQYSSNSGGNSKQKEQLHKILELAAKFYQVQFSKNQIALEYVLKKRRFSKQTALEWRLGYSPNTGSALVDFLRSKKFGENDIKEAGLSSQRYRGLGDMFRSRLMIPLQDQTGRVIGFTARLLADDPNAPKYINTPQTLLYDKSRHVYGLHLAKEAIRKIKYAVVAEGNLDVIASHQAGVRQVVATAGTALTDQHLKALSRFTPDIRLSFDADNAGLNATERAIPIASKVGVSLSVISIPSGKDPDELLKQDPALWQAIIDKPQYALDWLIERYAGKLDITSAQGKREFSDIILRVVRDLDDRVEQEHYLEKVGQMIGVSREALITKLTQPAASVPQKLKPVKIPAKTLNKTALEIIKTENHLLALAMVNPKMHVYLKGLVPQMLLEGQAQELLEVLQQTPDFDPENPVQMQNRGEYVKMLLLLHEELYQDLEISELQYEAAQLQEHLVKYYVRTQKGRIVRELAKSNDARTQELLAAVKKLDNLLNQLGRT
jgi:DNA primase